MGETHRPWPSGAAEKGSALSVEEDSKIPLSKFRASKDQAKFCFPGAQASPVTQVRLDRSVDTTPNGIEEGEKIFLRETIVTDVEDAPVGKKRKVPPEVAQVMNLVNETLRAGAEDAAVAVVANAMMENLCSSKLQAYGNSVLFSLAHKNSANRSAIVQSGAVDVIVQGMSSSLSDSRVQQTACRILWLLALDEQHKPEIIKANGCYSLIDALERHRDVESLVIAAFGAIKPFSFDDTGRAMLKEKEATRAVARAMMVHAKTANIQSDGCSLLSNIAVDVLNNAVTPLELDEVNAVLNAMMEHPYDASVQKQACFALKNFAFSRRNLETIARSELPASVLLDCAAKNFPIECMRDAEALLQLLPNLRLGNVPEEKPESANIHQLGVVQQARPENLGPAAIKAFADKLMDNAILSGQHNEYRSAQSQFELSLEMKRSVYGPGAVNEDLVNTLKCVAYVCAILGDYTSAIGKYRESLTMHRRILGEDAKDIGLAETMSTIGKLYLKCQDYGHAEDFLWKALDMRKRIHARPTENADTAKDLESLGDVNRICGHYEEAEDFYKEAAKCYKNSNSSGSEREISNVMVKIGLSAGARSDNDVARINLETALEMKRDIYGASAMNSDLSNTLNSLAYINAVCGNVIDAIRMYGESVEMQYSTADANTTNQNLANTLSSLGVLCMKSGDPGNARAHLEEALDMKRSIYGGEMNRDLFGILTNLGQACIFEQEWDEAEAYYEEALKYASRERNLTMDAANILLQLGHIASERSNFASSREHYSNALRMKESIYGSRTVNGDIVEVLNRLGYVCGILGDYSGAIDKYELSLKMQRDIHGTDAVNKDVACTLNCLGILSLKESSYTKAQIYLMQALNMKKRMYGECAINPDIASTLRNLGDLFSAQKRFQEADRCYEEACTVKGNMENQTNISTELEDENHV